MNQRKRRPSVSFLPLSPLLSSPFPAETMERTGLLTKSRLPSLLQGRDGKSTSAGHIPEALARSERAHPNGALCPAFN